MKITEQNFVLELKKKNEKALYYVIDNYGGLIKLVVRKHLNNLLTYEDECINDVLLGIWNNINYFDEKRSSFKNWICGIARFKAIDYTRAHLKNIENTTDLNLEIPTEDTTEKIIENELSKEINEIMDCLKEKDKQIFYKMYIEDKHIDEVCLDVCMKKENIYNRISRAKRKINKIFKVDSKGGIKYEK